jgi:hypothetical protein
MALGARDLSAADTLSHRGRSGDVPAPDHLAKRRGSAGARRPARAALQLGRQRREHHTRPARRAMTGDGPSGLLIGRSGARRRGARHPGYSGCGAVWRPPVQSERPCGGLGRAATSGTCGAGWPPTVAVIGWHEYDDLARGQVVADRDGVCITVYADPALLGTGMRDRICAAFRLPDAAAWWTD